MELAGSLNTLLNPPVLFFLLGIVAVLVRSNLEIPPQIAKFLSLYLLFVIGLKGGEELAHSGLTPVVGKVMLCCMLFSFLVPMVVYPIIRRKLVNADASAIAATYGSVSAVTFATAIAYLESHHIHFGGYMVAGMALMESPAIVSGLLLYHFNRRREQKQLAASTETSASNTPSHRTSKRAILHEAFFNGSVFLLIGSLVIGMLTGHKGEVELSPFITDIFKGMLCLYMLDMGLLAARRFKDLKASGYFLGAFGILYPLLASLLGVLISSALGLQVGDALLLTVLLASASYIAVPAAMRNAIPEANMSLLLPMALGITFTFNILLGIPLYYHLILMARGGP